MIDLKYLAQLKAEELAEEQGKQWDDLPQEEQYTLYEKAYQSEVERLNEGYERRWEDGHEKYLPD